MSKIVTLKVASAFVVGGRIARVGEIVDVSYAEAKDLLHRGKAVLAVAEHSGADVAKPAEAETKPAEPETKPAEDETQPAEPVSAKSRSKKAK